MKFNETRLDKSEFDGQLLSVSYPIGFKLSSACLTNVHTSNEMVANPKNGIEKVTASNKRLLLFVAKSSSACLPTDATTLTDANLYWPVFANSSLQTILCFVISPYSSNCPRWSTAGISGFWSGTFRLLCSYFWNEFVCPEEHSHREESCCCCCCCRQVQYIDIISLSRMRFRYLFYTLVLHFPFSCCPLILLNQSGKTCHWALQMELPAGSFVPERRQYLPLRWRTKEGSLKLSCSYSQTLKLNTSLWMQEAISDVSSGRSWGWEQTELTLASMIGALSLIHKSYILVSWIAILEKSAEKRQVV